MAPATEIRIPDSATGVILPDQRVPAGGSVAYRLSALAGQRLSVAVNPFSVESLSAIALEVTGPGSAAVLQPRTPGVAAWEGELPASQTYRLTVTNEGPATGFALHVQIPRRINFVPGPIAAKVNGVVVPPVGNVYLLTARAGQVLTATVRSDGDLVWLGLVGEDGQPLVRSHMGQATFAGTLPIGGDYTLDVVVLQEPAPPTVPYTLTLEMTD